MLLFCFAEQSVRSALQWCHLLTILQCFSRAVSAQCPAVMSLSDNCSALAEQLVRSVLQWCHLLTILQCFSWAVGPSVSSQYTPQWPHLLRVLNCRRILETVCVHVFALLCVTLYILYCDCSGSVYLLFSVHFDYGLQWHWGPDRHNRRMYRTVMAFITGSGSSSVFLERYPRRDQTDEW